MGNKLKPIIAVLIFIGVCFLGCEKKSTSSSIIELPIEISNEPIVNLPLLDMPVKAALIVDVSGTMDKYQTTVLNQTPLLDYIVNRLNTIWVPWMVVERSNNPSSEQRYSITKAYGLGTGIEEVRGFASLKPVMAYRTIKRAFSTDFLKYTSIDQATNLVSVLMSPTSQEVSTVVMVTDMEIDIGIVSGCPKGSPPFCVIEKLRPLYKNDLSPGWWLVGFDVPYDNGIRPLFLSIWSYDILQTRDMIDRIVQNLMKDMAGIITADNIHVLELYPADSWKPASDKPWVPKGRVTYKEGSPLKWIKSESSFIVKSLYENAELDFSLKRFDQDRVAFEVPYEQNFNLKLGNTTTIQNVSFVDKIIEKETFDFRTIISSGQFNGNFSNPDFLDIVVTVYPRFNLGMLPWISKWSERIPQFNLLVEGVNSIMPVEKQTLSSRPIHLKFRKN